MEIITNIFDLLGSPTFGVILSLLLVFQWYKQHAKEQAVKNSLFAHRRKFERTFLSSSNTNEQKRLSDTIDDVDAILATLGSRKPFQDKVEKMNEYLMHRQKEDETKPLGVPVQSFFRN
jgi:hypothetical protein